MSTSTLTLNGNCFSYLGKIVNEHTLYMLSYTCKELLELYEAERKKRSYVPMDWYYLHKVSEFPYLPVSIEIDYPDDDLQYSAYYRTTDASCTREIVFKETRKYEQPRAVLGTNKPRSYAYITRQIVNRTVHFLKNIDLDKNEYRSKSIKKEITEYIKSLRSKLETESSGYDEKFWTSEINRLKKKWKLREHLTDDQALYITDLIHKIVFDKYRAANVITECLRGRTNYLWDGGDVVRRFHGPDMVSTREVLNKFEPASVRLHDMTLRIGGNKVKDLDSVWILKRNNFDAVLNDRKIDYIIDGKSNLTAFHAVEENGYVIVVRVYEHDRYNEDHHLHEVMYEQKLTVVYTQISINEESNHRYKFVKEEHWDIPFTFEEIRFSGPRRFSPSVIYRNGKIHCNLGRSLEESITYKAIFATIDIKSGQCTYLHDSIQDFNILNQPLLMSMFQNDNSICYLCVCESRRTQYMLHQIRRLRKRYQLNVKVHFFINRNGIKMRKTIYLGGYTVLNVQKSVCLGEKFTFYLHCYRNNMVNDRKGHIKEFSIIKVEV